MHILPHVILGDEHLPWLRTGTLDPDPADNNRNTVPWLALSIQAGYRPADAALENFLHRVGRRKFVLPLYRVLLAVPGGPERARRIYKESRPNYHAVTTSTLDALLG